ncbi:Ribosomal Proteins L2 domain protein (apicoplast) [Theileria parva strain Muguga]|uniref:Ribosomal protein L2, putative n=1 Tax=Theileria parva TaxID=5875 RepID=Q4MYC0_THEPA|nr:Ribosomal Proteins L2 domain protein [Theileria parva strain Muguga]|eukprot:XP_762672.1 ribosomal protein L2 (apicoplast) [Theileria parva strain Muguga]
MVIFKINYNKKIGKNNYGRIVTRHREKGRKSLYIPIDLNYFNYETDKKFYIRLLSTESNHMYRNTKLILGLSMEGKTKGQLRYIIKPNKKSLGDLIKFTEKTSKHFGDINYLNNFDINDKLYSLEFKPKIKSKICLSAKCVSILLNKENNLIKIKLPSNKIKKLNNKCYAVYGNSEKVISNFKQKAGTERLFGNRPKVRGSAMNACDHPHGGGEGKAPIGRRSICSFKGKKTKGVKTVKFKNDYIK